MVFFGSAEQASPRTSLLTLVILIVFGIPSHCLGQGLQPDEPRSDTVHGTVINAATGAPIPRALVFTRDNHVATLTDGEGHFELTLPKQLDSMGSVFSLSGPVSATPRIYRRRGRSVMLSARKPGFLEDVSAQVNPVQSSGDDITIALSPEAIIKGRITLASGDAALGIRVQLFSRQVQDGFPRWLQGPSVAANFSGEFRFAELRAGSYKLVTNEFMDNDPITNLPGSQQNGYPPVYYPGSPDFSAASAIQLIAGQEFEADLSLTRQPYFPVRIPVGNTEGVGGLNVSVQGQRGPGYSLGYNGTNQRIEGLLPNGSYIVEANTFGRDVGHTPLHGSVALRVTETSLMGPVMALAPTSSIQLNVKEDFTDSSWNGSMTWHINDKTFSVQGPRVYLSANLENADELAQPRNGSIRMPQGPNDESLVIENLAPGRYWLRLHTGRGYIASATQGATDLLHWPLTVGSGPAPPIEITLRDDFAELDGTITALAHQSTPNADSVESTPPWIYCVPLPDSAGELVQSEVSNDGRFTYPQMPPGDYRVLAFSRHQPQLPYRDPEAMKVYESKGQVVHLTAGQKTAVQVQTVLSE